MKRTAVIIIIVLLLTVVGLLLIYRNHLRVEADIVANFNSNQLTLAELIGSETELTMNAIRREIAIASRISSIVKGDERCPADMQIIYGDLKEKSINILFRLDERGILTHHVPEDRLKGAIGKDFSFREYFKEVKKTGRPYISRMLLAGGEKYEGVEGRFKTILIVVPLYNNGKFAGVLGVGLDFASILEKSVSARMAGIKGIGYCWIINNRGIFVAHPIKEFIGRNAFDVRKERAPDISFEEINRIMRDKMMKGEKGKSSYISGWYLEEKGRIKKLIAYAPFYLNGKQYSVAVAIPEAEVISLSRKNFENTLITMAVIMVIMLFGLFYILSLNRRRIRLLEKETEMLEKVKESEEKYSTLVKTSKDCIFITSKDGRIIDINDAGVELFGYGSKDDLMKVKVYETYENPEDGKIYSQIQLAAQQGFIKDLAVNLRRKDGSIINALITSVVRRDENWNVTGYQGIIRDITEQKQIEEELARIATEQKNIMETISEGIYTLDLSGNLVNWNRAMEVLTGLSAEELMGKPGVELFAEEDRASVAEAIRKVLEEGIGEVTGSFLRKDHPPVIYQCNGVQLKDPEGNVIGLIGVGRDITESEQARAEIINLKEYSEKIIANIPSSLLVLDKDLNIKLVNRTYRKIRGIGDADVIGKNIKEVFPEHLLKEGGLIKAFEDVMETGETRRLYGVKHASSDHPEKILNITASGIRRTEEDIILVIEDVTESARLAEEIIKKNKELESFVYTISHDLRAPIVSIQGFSSILLSDFQDALPDTGKRYLARIQANVRQMEILIDDLLKFSRIGKMGGAFEDIPSAEVIRDVLGVLGPQLKKRGIKLDVQGRLPVIRCDKTRIFQVFENLIQNSIKYMGDTESPAIEIGCKKAGGFHEFYVKDNGIGIDPKYHQKIFQIFQRLKEVDTKGTGIGLSTVEKIVEVHGGSVRVESEKGRGATFWFSVPESAFTAEDVEDTEKKDEHRTF